MIISEYKIKNANLAHGLVFALVSDLHGEAAEPVIEAVRSIKPDYILAAGDIFEPLLKKNEERNESGYKLLAECARIAPTVYSPGNHEIGGDHSWSPKWRLSKGKAKTYNNECIERLRKTGVYFLDDELIELEGITFGGLCSGIINDDMKPDLRFVSRFLSAESPKVLVCHHPEYYRRYLREKEIDLIVSGHAHGGQWRFFGRGVFAPGQGIFPKYTSGVYDNCLVVSRGLCNNARIPRFFNPTEVVKIVIE